MLRNLRGLHIFNMGSTHSKNTELSEDDSDESSDLIDLSVLEPVMNVVDTSDFVVDAATSSKCNRVVLKPLSRWDVHKIVDMLDPYEKVSLVFLLVCDSAKALHIMKNIKYNNDFLGFLLKCLDQKTDKTILEALCIIQNYQVLGSLGYNKDAIIKEFFPMAAYSATYVDKIRKTLYRLMEDLNEEEGKQLICAIKEDIPDLVEKYNYLEMYFAYMFQINYISTHDFCNLIKHLKQIVPDNLFLDYLKAQNTSGNTHVAPVKWQSVKSENNIKTDESNTNEELDTWTAPSCSRNSQVSTRIFEDLSKVYKMDSQNPGICLIIENISFYNDFGDYEHLVVETTGGLETRTGTEADSERLIDVFTRFGYRVIHEKHKTHIEMLEVIENVACNETESRHSSFVLIILTHGKENAVIGCNSVPLNIDAIKKKINSKVLENKPKILIIQACQGDKKMQGENDDTVTDSPCISQQVSRLPWQKHIIDLRATVKGYACYRHKRNGSWMIQNLCNVLETHPEEPFNSICELVNNMIGQEKWDNNVMVSTYSSTLDKKLYLPPLRPASS